MQMMTTMSIQSPPPVLGGALVSKSGASQTSPAEYLRLADDGAMSWVLDPLAATPFPSMRDAMRVAMRLPAQLRAFGLPRQAEVGLGQAN
jgi:hypothetical protein